MFTFEQGAELVKLARHAIETLLFNQPLNLEPYKKFNEVQGVYVTIKKDGKLRGQMGALQTKDKLFQAVLKAARDAAFNDKRFSPLSQDEFKDIEIEVTLIIQPRLLRVLGVEDYYRQIHPETDGLMIKSGVYSAIMLPNPEMRYGWNVERVLRHLCISAGLTMDAWKDLSQDVYVFQCQTFAERNGKVVEII